MNDWHERLCDEHRALNEKKARPEWMAPMLAVLSHEHFSDEDWIYERKLDGQRCLAFRNGSTIGLMSRNKKSLNKRYPELVDGLAGTKPRQFVIDGEIVTFEGNVTSFRQLQPRMQARKATDRDEPPFEGGKLPGKDIHWVNPELVAEIGFTEWTRENRLRHPRLLGLRDGKDPREVVGES